MVHLSNVNVKEKCNYCTFGFCTGMDSILDEKKIRVKKKKFWFEMSNFDKTHTHTYAQTVNYKHDETQAHT